MEELKNNHEQAINFIKPSLEYEVGEIERTADHFNIDREDFRKKFLKEFEGAVPEYLPSDEWNTLENSDSNDITLGDWESVKYHANHIGRDWESIRNKMQNGDEIEAPIILNLNNQLYLIAGNTRLMVAKALGIMPKVIKIKMSI